jgi:GNAT superfamily N-acetyltransferase
LYEHGLIAVQRDYRRRGIARAMKIAQLRWLKDHGATRVVTWNAETNEAARKLNLSLGYRPLTSSIAFHSPT